MVRNALLAISTITIFFPGVATAALSFAEPPKYESGRPPAGCEVRSEPLRITILIENEETTGVVRVTFGAKLTVVNPELLIGTMRLKDARCTCWFSRDLRTQAHQRVCAGLQINSLFELPFVTPYGVEMLRIWVQE